MEVCCSRKVARNRVAKEKSWGPPFRFYGRPWFSPRMHPPSFSTFHRSLLMIFGNLTRNSVQNRLSLVIPTVLGQNLKSRYGRGGLKSRLTRNIREVGKRIYGPGFTFDFQFYLGRGGGGIGKRRERFRSCGARSSSSATIS